MLSALRREDGRSGGSRLLLFFAMIARRESEGGRVVQCTLRSCSFDVGGRRSEEGDGYALAIRT